jgi:hypothetical protein
MRVSQDSLPLYLQGCRGPGHAAKELFTPLVIMSSSAGERQSTLAQEANSTEMDTTRMRLVFFFFPRLLFVLAPSLAGTSAVAHRILPL